MAKAVAVVSVRLFLILGLLAMGASGLWAAPVDCSTITTLASLLSAGSCVSGDKIYSNFADGGATALGPKQVPTNWTVSLTTGPVSPGVIAHDFTVSAPSGNVGAGAGTYSLSYEIYIDPTSPSYATNWITSAQASFNLSSSTGTDTKALYEIASGGGKGAFLTNIVSTGTSTSVTVHEKGLYVVETVVTAGGLLHSITDDFIETNVAIVPEPASMALMGAGLLALGGLLRRKKQRTE